jgi:CBS domain-containing protein
MLFIIAFIIFFGAIQEYVSAESRAVSVAFSVSDAMIPRERLETFTHATTVAQAMKVVLTSLQPLYPVLVGENVIGVVFREDILHHAATEPNEYISSIATREVPTVTPEQPLTDVFSLIQNTGIPVVLVMREDSFVGILVHERLAEFLVLSSIPERHKRDDDTEWSMPL